MKHIFPHNMKITNHKHKFIKVVTHHKKDILFSSIVFLVVHGINAFASGPSNVTMRTHQTELQKVAYQMLTKVYCT